MRRLIHFSGAGVSAESGIETFRGTSTSLWQGHDVDVVCNIDTWEANVDAVHAFYDEMRIALADVKPNAAHAVVAEAAQHLPTITITQNIDDLFEKAGLTDVIHLHGHLTKMRCMDCGDVWDIGYAAYNRLGCRDQKCQSPRVKPAVVFFGEMAPDYAKLHRVLESLTDEDLIFVVGTSSRVVNIDDMLRGRPGSKILVDTTGRYQHQGDEVYHLHISETAVQSVPTLREIIMPLDDDGAGAA